MPGFIGGSSGASGASGEIRFPAEFIDPVTKLRVSQPETLIDTDFEYGLQPTKWETVELINNTPSFFSKSGDTTIPNLSDMTTTEGSREVKVTTSLPHGLAVGIPINVSGTKSLTADGAYIINSVPDANTFTYLCKQNQAATASIVDLYTNLVTGEFFQGSQIKISDSEGIITDGETISTLTVKTDSPHGFGLNSPFYFLNLNSTVSQAFDSSNSVQKTFDSSNSSTAQTFDGSNSLTSYTFNLSNSANTNGSQFASTITATNTTADTVTVSHPTQENFAGRQTGTPLYYNVNATSGYFAENPRGVVFLKSTGQLGTSTSTFQVSTVPAGNAIDITGAMSGTFQVANSARLFAGNNTDLTNQTTVDIDYSTAYSFDGSNTLGSVNTYNSFSGANITITNSAGSTVDPSLYVGAMFFYTTTGTALGGLTNNTTYWVRSVAAGATAGVKVVTISATPTGTAITITSGGSGTHTFRKIGVSLDKDYIHVPGHNFNTGDMVEYSFPAGGAVTRSNSTSGFMYVATVADAYNVQLKNDKGSAPTGLTVDSPGVSAAQLKADWGYNTNGVYYISLNNVSTPVYCIMDSAIDGGGWMMMLKATRGNTFQFQSNYWTTNNTLNPTQTNQNDGDAKFDVMNYFQAKDMLALWPDLGQGGCISASGYPYIWLQNNFYSGTRIVPITFWSTVDRYFLGDANNFCGIGNFSRQTDVRFYGFNYRNNQDLSVGTRTRWGFGWNENGGGLYPNGNMDSDDVAGGIGMNGVQQNTGTRYSAGDVIGCCQNVSGMNRSARVELYVR